MKKFILLFITLIYSYGFYSIQLYTSVNKKYANKYFKTLAKKIKQKSFIYLTDSGYYTIRYLVSPNVKNLKKFHIKNSVIVIDDTNKLKQINTPYIKNILLKFEIIKPIKQSNPPKKQILINKKPTTQKKPKKLHKKTKIILPDWVKMNIALKNKNLDAIQKLLNKKIDIYQKISALKILKQNKKLENTIFNYESVINDQNLYNTYFELLQNRYISFSTTFENKDRYNNILNNIEYKNNDYKLNINYDNINHQKNKELLFTYKNTQIGFRDSNNTFISLKSQKTIQINKIKYIFSGGINQNSLDNDTLFNTSINNFISLKTNFTTHRNFLEFNSVFSKYYYQNHSFMLNKSELTLSDIYTYNSLLNFSSYIKNIRYSTLLQSYNELGIGMFYGYGINHLKTAKFFINPSITYNTISNIGYSISIGMNQRIITADNLKIICSYSKDQFGDTTKCLINYIYY